MSAENPTPSTRFPGFREMVAGEVLVDGDMFLPLGANKLQRTIAAGEYLIPRDVGHYFRPIPQPSPSNTIEAEALPRALTLEEGKRYESENGPITSPLVKDAAGDFYGENGIWFANGTPWVDGSGTSALYGRLLHEYVDPTPQPETAPSADSANTSKSVASECPKPPDGGHQQETVRAISEAETVVLPRPVAEPADLIAVWRDNLKASHSALLEAVTRIQAEIAKWSNPHGIASSTACESIAAILESPALIDAVKAAGGPQ